MHGGQEMSAIVNDINTTTVIFSHHLFVIATFIHSLVGLD